MDVWESEKPGGARLRRNRANVPQTAASVRSTIFHLRRETVLRRPSRLPGRPRYHHPADGPQEPTSVSIRGRIQITGATQRTVSPRPAGTRLIRNHAEIREGSTP